MDYLAAEISKIDKALDGEFSHSESAPLLTQMMTGFVDVLAVAISSAPFVAIAQILSGDFTAPRTMMSVAVMIGMLAFFYLSLTMALGGKDIRDDVHQYPSG